jgi:hypothetical protein
MKKSASKKIEQTSTEAEQRPADSTLPTHSLTKLPIHPMNAKFLKQISPQR